MRPGIPSIAEVAEAERTGFFREMSDYAERFAQRARPALRWYRWAPSGDPMKNWSRRWEYPFVAERLLAVPQHPGRTITVLDAGSGLTFLPFFLRDRIAGAEIVCCDSDPRLARMMRRAARTLGVSRVRFVRGDLSAIPAEDASFDALCCVSVLEHTRTHERILDEFRRVLRPGGRLVLTFDVSLDERRELTRTHAVDLLRLFFERFENDERFEFQAELARLDRPDDLLTTDAVRRTRPDLLPWKHPLLKSAYDFVAGRGWSGGFYSLTCCGVSGLRRD